jgi:gentisate 1,2-dioxygenase
MNELGRLEDLPAEYVQDLRNVNLVPLWPSLRGVLPNKIPSRKTQPTCWAYKDIRPLLLKAGELTPIESNIKLSSCFGMCQTLLCD